MLMYCMNIFVQCTHTCVGSAHVHTHSTYVYMYVYLSIYRVLQKSSTCSAASRCYCIQTTTPSLKIPFFKFGCAHCGGLAPLQGLPFSIDYMDQNVELNASRGSCWENPANLREKESVGFGILIWSQLYFSFISKIWKHNNQEKHAT